MLRLLQSRAWRVALLSLTFAAWCGSAFLVSSAFYPSAALAQDDEESSDTSEEEEDRAAKSAKEAAESQENLLAFSFEALGWTYSIVFLAISFWFVALIVMCVMMLQRDKIMPTQLAELFEAHLNEKRYQEAFDLAKSDDSFLGMVLAAGMSKLQQGYPKVVEAMQEVAADENMKLEHKLSHLALIGTISPMVGLLGTVHGMVESFMVIAKSTVTPSPAELAKGISTALITTLVGLILAIPAVMAYAFLRNRLNRLMLEAGIIAGNLMGRFENVGAKKA
jgi:biopolymer transport protein ExbB